MSPWQRWYNRGVTELKETYVQNEDREDSLLPLASQLLSGKLDILLQFLDGIFQCRPGIIDLIYDQDALADQVLHLAQTRQIQPLCPRDLGTELLDIAGSICAGSVGGRKRFVERQANGLDRDVGRAWLLEEGPQNSSRHISTTTDCNHKLWLEVLQDARCCFLAQLVNLDTAVSLALGALEG